MSPYCDSLLAEAIVSNSSRSEAIARMKRALGELMVEGVKSTNALRLALVNDEGVRKGKYHTGYLEENPARNVGSIAE